MTSPPLLGRHAMQHGVARNAGIVDDHRHGADLRFNLFQARSAGVITADIPFENRNAGFRLEFLRGFIVAAIVGGDPESAPFQFDGNCVAYPTRASCYHSHTGHVPSVKSFGGCGRHTALMVFSISLHKSALVKGTGFVQLWQGSYSPPPECRGANGTSRLS